MKAGLLVEAEISRHPWSSLREANGFAAGIPSALRELLSAQTPAEVEEAYWRVENHVVVQGQLFEAAVATTQVLTAALVDEGRPGHVRIGILELLFQMVSGEAHESATARGAADLGEQCRSAAREGLWILYRELIAGEAAAAREVLDVIERERARLLEVDRRSAT